MFIPHLPGGGFLDVRKDDSFLVHVYFDKDFKVSTPLSQNEGPWRTLQESIQT